MNSIRNLVGENGFTVVPRLSAHATALEIAASLGDPVKLGDLQMVQRLVPQTASTPNTYSGNFGVGRFPIHTDLAQWRLPPRYLMLRCVKGHADVPTLVLDGDKIVTALGAETMRRALVRPRRPQGGAVRLLRLLDAKQGAEILRWDGLYLKPASRIGELVYAAMHECIDAMKPETISLVDEGDTLIIDNWRMLHGRSAVSEDHRDRCLERVYLRSLN